MGVPATWVDDKRRFHRFDPDRAVLGGFKPLIADAKSIGCDKALTFVHH
jgi:hypothetical protein